MSMTSSIREQHLKRIHNYISRMPSLSTTVTKVLEVCNSPAASPNDLNRVISLDPVLTGHVLRLINSAYYSLPNQVVSLTRAIIMLGLNTIKNVVLSAAVMESLGGKDSFQAIRMDDFWTHCLCAGVTAKTLSAVKGVPPTEREEYFVAGLLHDLGKIPLNKRFPEEYAQVMQLASAEGNPLYQAEHAVLGIDHCTVGQMIGEKWKLSEVMIDALCSHHHPRGARSENREFITIIALANAYANSCGAGSGDDFSADGLVSGLLEEAGVDGAVLSDLRGTVLSEIEKARVFLQITRGG